ncbi:MAG: hypothetical protein B7Z55_08930 [Planctomycetales bacterium 12-60-4]|nr:MAG: hypothetical protein B7Z55_08930 [Planctomycetales bacterium 12-60-4]
MVEATSRNNLALACIDCNLRKGSNIAGFDPVTDVMTPLFHPRQDDWNHHFQRDGAVIVGLTDVGRTTVAVLDVNSAERCDLRLSEDTSV